MDKLLASPEMAPILVPVLGEPFSVNHQSHPPDKVTINLCGVFFPGDYVILKQKYSFLIV